MRHKDPIYPAKKNLSPEGNFIVPQFFLPIRLNGEEIWALLDTGAHVSILPKEVSDNVLSHFASTEDSGNFSLARLIQVPYESYKLDFQILEHIPDTIPNLNIQPYTEDPNVVASLSRVEFQKPTKSWPEIAEEIYTNSPIEVVDATELDYVILGLYGVLDQLAVSFVGDNSIRIGPIEAPHGFN